MDCSPPGSPVQGIFPGKNTGVGCCFLLHRIFSTQGLNLGLLHCRQILYHLSYQGSPIIEDWNAKVGSQEIPRVPGKFGLQIQNEAWQRLTEFCLENGLVIANTSSNHTRGLYTWTSPDGQYWNQIDYILCSQRWKTYIVSKSEFWS